MKKVVNNYSLYISKCIKYKPKYIIKQIIFISFDVIYLWTYFFLNFIVSDVPL